MGMESLLEVIIKQKKQTNKSIEVSLQRKLLWSYQNFPHLSFHTSKNNRLSFRSDYGCELMGEKNVCGKEI